MIMRKPTLFVVVPLFAAVYGPPLLHLAKQAIDGGEVTQKPPPPIGLQVLTSASANDTGVAIGPVADLTLCRMIQMPQIEKPAQMQIPIKGISDAGSTDLG
jgi:hypothetical protein